MEALLKLFETNGGALIAMLGAALCVLLCCIGSAKGTGMVGQAIAGLLSDDPSLSGKCLLYQVMPGSQGLYGFLILLFMLLKLNAFAGFDNMTVLTATQGWVYFAVCIPMMLGGFLSAIYQGKVAADCINVVAKQPENSSKGMMHVIIVEFYALLPLVASILPIISL
jgi:V/A-type H+-transporting ATPase subunit K